MPCPPCQRHVRRVHQHAVVEEGAVPHRSTSPLRTVSANSDVYHVIKAVLPCNRIGVLRAARVALMFEGVAVRLVTYGDDTWKLRVVSPDGEGGDGVESVWNASTTGRTSRGCTRRAFLDRGKQDPSSCESAVCDPASSGATSFDGPGSFKSAASSRSALRTAPRVIRAFARSRGIGRVSACRPSQASREGSWPRRSPRRPHAP